MNLVGLIVRKFDREPPSIQLIFRAKLNRIHGHISKILWWTSLRGNEALTHSDIPFEIVPQGEVEVALDLRGPCRWSLDKNHVPLIIGGYVTPEFNTVCRIKLDVAEAGIVESDWLPMSE